MIGTNVQGSSREHNRSGGPFFVSLVAEHNAA